MSSGEKYMPPKVRCIETGLNKDTLVDIVAVYLQGISVVRDSEDITNIEFGTPKDGIIPIKIYFKKGGK